MWFTALLLSALVAGCGGDDDDSPGPGAAGTACSAGADCVALATAGDFAILAQSAISETGTSAINGNVGLAAGAGITGLTCAEMTGSIIDEDAGYDGEGGPTTCLTTTAGRITTAVADATTAFNDANTRTPDFTPGGTTITAADCAGAGPGVYAFGGAVTITEDCVLTGTSTDVWIFQVAGTLSQTAATTMSLAGGALPQNVFWQTDTNVAIGDGAHLEGVVLAGSTIVLGNGASVKGRLLSNTAVTLDTNTVARP